MPDDGTTRAVLEKVSYEFSTTDGPDAAWHVHRMKLSEGINELYELEVDLVTPDLDAEIRELLGASAEFVMGRRAHARPVFGIVSDFEHLGQWGHDLLVRARIVPAFALLRQCVRTRIFQHLTTQQILERVLTESLGPYGRTFAMDNLDRGRTIREYCVQYAESDHDFVVRLLEDEGISFTFRHDEGSGREILVLTAANTHFERLQNVDGSSIFPFAPHGGELAPVESMRTLDWVRTLSHTAVMRRDYDWRQPMNLLTEEVGGADERGRIRSSFEHLGRRYIEDDVYLRAQDRLESLRAREYMGRGESNATAFRVGATFELDQHPHVAELEGSLVLTWVVHEGYCPEALVGSERHLSGSRLQRYRNVFECVPAGIPIRPRRTIGKPVIAGPQTAIVSGPAGEEIETDRHGRVRVQFPWEPDGKYDEGSSCWVRVAQRWAGNGWGSQFIPRIGMEVVVEFVEGDPDRPLVTGCVYNGQNAPPFALPDEKTKSGIRTDSSTGTGANELRFEDAAGSEQIYVRAQRDKVVDVRHDHFRSVLNDEFLFVAHDQTREIGHDRAEKVGRDQSFDLGRNLDETIGGHVARTVGGDDKIEVEGSREQTVAKSCATTVTERVTVRVGKSSTEDVGEDKCVRVEGSWDESVGKHRTIIVEEDFTSTTGGATRLRADKDAELTSKQKMALVSEGAMSLRTSSTLSMNGNGGVIELADELTIKVGKASIVLKKNGDIEINGAKVQMKTSGNVVIKGGKLKQN